jgi:hypothetical protein
MRGFRKRTRSHSPAEAVPSARARSPAKPGLAQSSAVQTMATILLHFQHFPSDADKESLQRITADKSTTPDERTVAQALMRVQHTAAAADKPKLEAILEDDKASSPVKTLASVVLNLKHMPSESDMEKLQALTT